MSINGLLFHISCFSEPALLKSNLSCWLSTKQTSPSSHRNIMSFSMI